MNFKQIDDLFKQATDILNLVFEANNKPLLQYQSGVVSDINIYSKNRDIHIWFIYNQYDKISRNNTRGRYELVFITTDELSNNNDITFNKVKEMDSLANIFLALVEDLINNEVSDMFEDLIIQSNLTIPDFSYFNTVRLRDSRITPVIKFKAKNTFSGVMVNVNIDNALQSDYCDNISTFVNEYYYCPIVTPLLLEPTSNQIAIVNTNADLIIDNTIVSWNIDDFPTLCVPSGCNKIPLVLTYTEPMVIRGIIVKIGLMSEASNNVVIEGRNTNGTWTYISSNNLVFTNDNEEVTIEIVNKVNYDEIRLLFRSIGLNTLSIDTVTLLKAECDE